jgi:hypothetical protein
MSQAAYRDFVIEIFQKLSKAVQPARHSAAAKLVGG